MYQVGDIIKFDCDFYEVEMVKKDSVTISSADRLPFDVEYEYISLVCPKQMRKDIQERMKVFAYSDGINTPEYYAANSLKEAMTMFLNETGFDEDEVEETDFQELSMEAEFYTKYGANSVRNVISLGITGYIG